MEKVSIGRSVAHAYGFVFARFFQIIGLAWLPALFYGAGYFFWLKNAGAWMPADQQTVIAGLQTVGFSLLAFFAAIMLHAVIANALTQQALGIRKDFALAHFVIGPRETHLFAALVRFFVIFVVFYVAWILLSALGLYEVKHFAGPGSAVATATTIRGVPLLPILTGAVSLALLFIFALSMLRLSFLLAPVAAVEPHVMLTRSWALTRGSAWRLLATYLCVILPVALAAGAAIWLLAGSDALHVTMSAKPLDPKLIGQFGADHALMLACVSGLVFVFMAALQSGATAEAYRTVTGHEEPESEDDDALVAPLLTPVVPAHAPDTETVHDDHAPDDQSGGHEPPAEEHGHHEDAANAAAHDGQDSHDVGAHAEPEPAQEHGGGGEHGHGGLAQDDHAHNDDGHSGHGHDDGGHGDHGHGDHGHDSHHANPDDGHSGHHALPDSGVLDTAGLQQMTHEDHAAAA